MRIALTLAALLASAPASAQMFVTSITAAIPDPAGKVPAFNVVPGAEIETWSNGLANAVLTHGQYYNYCISIASAIANGKADVTFKIARGATNIQSGTIIAANKFSVGANSIWYYCSGYTLLPKSPGAATLSGIVSYTAKDSSTPVVSKLEVPVLLK